MGIAIRRRVNWNHVGVLFAAVAFAVPHIAHADICHNDDLIVDGSVNIGVDSTCNRNFGFDTLVLSENNLRVYFEDTSTSASFPSNDWRIVINDTTNGGANYFGVEDSTAGRQPFRIEAGARVNALYVEGDGDVGLGTSNPVVNMHIVDGNTPTVRLEQDGSSGFTPQTWDLAGNEANFFIRDATNGSTLPFRIAPGAPTGVIRMFNNKIVINDSTANYDMQIKGDTKTNLFYVDASAEQIGIGTDAPTGLLHLFDDASVNLRVDGYGSGNDNVAIQLRKQDDSSANRTLLSRLFSTHSSVPDRFRIDHRVGGSPVGIIDMDNDGDVGIGVGSNALDHDLEVRNGALFSELDAGETQFANSSSRELKENIHPVKVENLLDKVASVPVVTYDWKQEVLNVPEEKRVDKMGLIAEDFHTVLERGSDKMLNGQEIQMTLWMSVQELHAENEELKARLAQLEQQVQPEE